MQYFNWNDTVFSIALWVFSSEKFVDYFTKILALFVAMGNYSPYIVSFYQKYTEQLNHSTPLQFKYAYHGWLTTLYTKHNNFGLSTNLFEARLLLKSFETLKYPFNIGCVFHPVISHIFQIHREIVFICIIWDGRSIFESVWV